MIDKFIHWMKKYRAFESYKCSCVLMMPVFVVLNFFSGRTDWIVLSLSFLIITISLVVINMIDIEILSRWRNYDYW